MNKSNIYERELASCLCTLREEKGMSQEALGIQLSKGQSDIAKIENGSKRVSVIEMLAWMSALNTPFERVETVLKSIYSSMGDIRRNSPWK